MTRVDWDTRNFKTIYCELEACLIGTVAVVELFALPSSSLFLQVLYTVAMDQFSFYGLMTVLTAIEVELSVNMTIPHFERVHLVHSDRMFQYWKKNAYSMRSTQRRLVCYYNK